MNFLRTTFVQHLPEMLKRASVHASRVQLGKSTSTIEKERGGGGADERKRQKGRKNRGETYGTVEGAREAYTRPRIKELFESQRRP